MQMGKFYELFEMDAHIGVKELDLQYMKVCLSLKALSILLSFQLHFSQIFRINKKHIS